MSFILGVLVALGIVATPAYILMFMAFNRCYKYASRQAARFDILDPRARAYEDMATVISLGGRASDKEWEDVDG